MHKTDIRLSTLVWPLSHAHLIIILEKNVGDNAAICLPKPICQLSTLTGFCLGSANRENRVAITNPFLFSQLWQYKSAVYLYKGPQLLIGSPLCPFPWSRHKSSLLLGPFLALTHIVLLHLQEPSKDPILSPPQKTWFTIWPWWTQACSFTDIIKRNCKLWNIVTFPWAKPSTDFLEYSRFQCQGNTSESYHISTIHSVL